MMVLTGFPVVSFVDSRQQGAPGYDGESTGADPWQDDSEEQVTASCAANHCKLLIKHEFSSQEAEILPPGTCGLERLLRSGRESQV